MTPWLRCIADEISNQFTQVKKTISSIAYLDFYQNVTYKFLSINDSSYALVMPDYDEHSETNPIKLIDSWHLTLKSNINTFVKNDIVMDQNHKSILLSGPNMGGKSTIMRQIAVNVILGQMGCFVTARQAILPIFDNIYSRIGSYDDLLRSKSTFLVECEEIKCALTNATPQSLCLIDEFGRGTSTFDGTAIAKCVLDHFLNNIKPWIVFSSHYKKLIDMYNTNDSIMKKYMG